VVGERVDQERRSITTLFADLQGYTAASERNDPEVVDEVVARLFDEMELVIETAGGRMPSRAGDGFIALFGTPTVSEDDPIRALECALELRDIARNAQARLEERLGMALPMRIGVNTGPVVVGRPTAGQRAVPITGDAVNVASRLEGLASPGSVLVAESTKRLAGARFQWGDSESLSVKNRQEPVLAHELLGVGAPPRPGRTPGRPFIGRSTELGQLSRAWTLAQRGEGQVVALRGAAGIGKSRLVHEFVGRIADEVSWAVLAACTQRGAGTLDPIRQLVTGLLEDLPDRDQLDGASREALDRLMLGTRVERGTLARRRDMIQALAGLFAAWAQDKPRLLIVEDAQWADPLSVAALAAIGKRLRTHRVMIIFTSRAHSRRLPRVLRQPTLELALGPLTAEQATTLLEVVSRGSGLDPGLRAVVLERAEGNPLFVEEIARVLAAGDAVVAPAGPVPDSVGQIFLARLDRIDPRSRRIAQEAAVIGRGFPDDLLAAVTDDPRSIRSSIHTLEQDEFLREWVPQVAGEGHQFTHYLTWNTVYESLLIRRRVELHLRTAGAIERMYPDELPHLAALLAHHYEMGDRPDEAAKYHLSSSMNSEAVFAPGDASSGRRRAAQLLGLAFTWRTSHVLRNSVTRTLLQAGLAIVLFAPALWLVFTQRPSRGEQSLGLPAALYDPGPWMLMMPLAVALVPVAGLLLVACNLRFPRYLAVPPTPVRLVVDTLVGGIALSIGLAVAGLAFFLGVRTGVLGRLEEMYAVATVRRAMEPGGWSLAVEVVVGGMLISLAGTIWLARRSSQWRRHFGSGEAWVEGHPGYLHSFAQLVSIAGGLGLAISLVLLFGLPPAVGLEASGTALTASFIFHLLLLVVALVAYATAHRLPVGRALEIALANLVGRIRWRTESASPRPVRGLGLEVPLLLAVVMGLWLSLSVRDNVVEALRSPVGADVASAERLVAWFPDSALAHASLGAALAREGPDSSGEAIAALERSIQLDPSLVGATANLSLLYATGSGDLDGALDRAEALVDAEPGHPISYLVRGVVRSLAGDEEGGASDLLFGAGLQLDSARWDAFHARCQIRQLLGSHQSALDDCARAGELNPRLLDDPHYLSLLATLGGDAGHVDVGGSGDAAESPQPPGPLGRADLDVELPFHDIRDFDAGPAYHALGREDLSAEHRVVAGQWVEFVDPRGPGRMLPVVMQFVTRYADGNGAGEGYRMLSDRLVLAAVRENVSWSPLPTSIEPWDVERDHNDALETGRAVVRLEVELGAETRSEDVVVVWEGTVVAMYLVSEDAGIDIAAVERAGQDRLGIGRP